MQDHKDKDIILGGLFTVHYDGVNASNDGGCGQVILGPWCANISSYVILYAVDVINNEWVYSILIVNLHTMFTVGELNIYL